MQVNNAALGFSLDKRITNVVFFAMLVKNPLTVSQGNERFTHV